MTKPAGWAVATRLAAAATSLLTAALLGRTLGPAGFGTVALVTSIATAAAFIGSAGMNRLLLRDVSRIVPGHQGDGLAIDDLQAEDRGRVGAEVALARGLLLRTVPFAAAVTVLAVWAFGGRDATSARLAVAAGVITIGLSLVLVLSDLLRGLGEVRWANLASGRAGGALVLGALAGLLLVIRPATPLAATICLAVAAAGSAVVLVVAVAKRRDQLPRSGSIMGTARWGLLMRALPFAGTQLMLFVGSQVDLWVAGGTIDAAEVGDYAAALRLMALVALPLTAAQLTMVAPIAAMHARGDRALLERRVRTAAATAGGPALVALVPCVMLPALTLEVVYGAQFRGAAPVLAVLALGQAVNVMTGLCGTVLSMAGRERVVLMVTGAGAVLSVGCCVVGSALGGAIGLAIASASTTAAVYLTMWWLSRRLLDVRTEPGWRTSLLRDEMPVLVS